jgi:hypothetical protein
MQKAIIMMDSPNAATKTTKDVWVSKQGRIFFDEHSARFDGCTHRRCEKCGKPCEKHWLVCEQCRTENRQDIFLKLPKVEWDGKTPLCIFDTDIYFFDSDELEDYCEEHGCKARDLPLVVCEPVFLKELTEEYFLDNISNEDVELPKDVQQLIEKFNQDLKVLNRPVVWEASNKRVRIT